MTDHGSIPLYVDSNFDFKVRVAWTGCRSTSWWLLVVSSQGRLLKLQALFHFSKTFCHFSWDFFNFLLLHPTPWLTVKDYLPFNLNLPIHSVLLCRGIANITICNWNWLMFSELKSRTMMFCCQKHCGNYYLWWHI